MNEVKRDVGKEVLEGLQEFKRGKHGRVVNVPDVIGIRKQAGLSQVHFARLLVSCPINSINNIMN